MLMIMFINMIGQELTEETLLVFLLFWCPCDWNETKVTKSSLNGLEWLAAVDTQFERSHSDSTEKKAIPQILSSQGNTPSPFTKNNKWHDMI